MKTIENSTFYRNPAYQETKQHTDTMFAFNIYPCCIPADFASVPLHWHDSMEIIYIKRGNGIVRIDFDSFHAEAGDIFLVLPGHLHELRAAQNKRMEYENIIFDMSFIGSGNVDLCSQKYLQPLLGGKLSFPSCIKKEHSLYAQVSACLNACDRLCEACPSGYELGVKGQLLVLFSILIQLAVKQAEQPGNDKNMQKLKAVLLLVEKDYNKKLTVGQIASACGYSASHFMRWFKSMTGSGFAGYLIEYRLGRAALALRDTDDTVLAVSEAAGFDNLSNFNRLFKKKYGMTPGRFRKQSLKNSVLP